MSRLSTRLAPTLAAATPFALLAREAIGGRWLRRGGRILLDATRAVAPNRRCAWPARQSGARARPAPVASAQPLASGAPGRLCAAVAWAATRRTRYADRINLYSPLNCYSRRIPSLQVSRQPSYSTFPPPDACFHVLTKTRGKPMSPRSRRTKISPATMKHRVTAYHALEDPPSARARENVIEIDGSS